LPGIAAAVQSHRVRATRPTLFLTVGLPGAGKTTRAQQLAREHAILRLTPDDWMAPLFGHSDAQGRRDILEGRMIWVAHEVLTSGAPVILDFGCWSPEERYAIRVVAQLAHADFTMEYLTIPEPERRARCDRRWAQAPETTFEMTSADHDRFVALCRPPTPSELSNGPVPAPPAGFATWPQWASHRWPTLPLLGP
jgi:predicted kinase